MSAGAYAGLADNNLQQVVVGRSGRVAVARRRPGRRFALFVDRDIQAAPRRHRVDGRRWRLVPHALRIRRRLLSHLLELLHRRVPGHLSLHSPPLQLVI